MRARKVIKRGDWSALPNQQRLQPARRSIIADVWFWCVVVPVRCVLISLLTVFVGFFILPVLWFVCFPAKPQVVWTPEQTQPALVAPIEAAMLIPATSPVVAAPVVSVPVDPAPVVSDPVDPAPVVSDPVAPAPVVADQQEWRPVALPPVSALDDIAAAKAASEAHVDSSVVSKSSIPPANRGVRRNSDTDFRVARSKRVRETHPVRHIPEPSVSLPWPHIAPQAPSPSYSSGGGTVYVKGYYRKDGTYVRGYTRRK